MFLTYIGELHKQFETGAIAAFPELRCNVAIHKAKENAIRWCAERVGRDLTWEETRDAVNNVFLMDFPFPCPHCGLIYCGKGDDEETVEAKMKRLFWPDPDKIQNS